jgi:hypothetical protein
VLDNLDSIPWANLEHAYGSAADVPALLRELLIPDPKVRGNALSALYSNVFHQGTRYPATAYVIPFLIEMCASVEVPDRYDLLRFWGSLIAGYFSVRARPCWGDGEQIHLYGEVREIKDDDGSAAALHNVYRESLKGHALLVNLLMDEDPTLRAGAAWVLACLPTRALESGPRLTTQVHSEESGWVRAVMAFALGELSVVTELWRILSEDTFAGARCMAACELARVSADESLIEPLLGFIATPIEEYEDIPGAGGKSAGDAAFSITKLPLETQRRALPTICDCLDHARSIDTLPLVYAIISAAFPQREAPLTDLDSLQTSVLRRMVNTTELWHISNLRRTFRAAGLPTDRKGCAELAGAEFVEDEAMDTLHSGLTSATIGHLEKARLRILKAMELDSAVLERALSPDECWLLCAKAFAETDPERAITAYQRAISINSGISRKVESTWRLADLLKKKGLS